MPRGRLEPPRCPSEAGRLCVGLPGRDFKGGTGRTRTGVWPLCRRLPFCLATVPKSERAGLEPASAVLETAGFPLTDRSTNRRGRDSNPRPRSRGSRFRDGILDQPDTLHIGGRRETRTPTGLTRTGLANRRDEPLFAFLPKQFEGAGAYPASRCRGRPASHGPIFGPLEMTGFNQPVLVLGDGIEPPSRRSERRVLPFGRPEKQIAEAGLEPARPRSKRGGLR